jgi:hypothetical protein
MTENLQNLLNAIDEFNNTVIINNSADEGRYEDILALCRSLRDEITVLAGDQ